MQRIHVENQNNMRIWQVLDKDYRAARRYQWHKSYSHNIFMHNFMSLPAQILRCGWLGDDCNLMEQRKKNYLNKMRTMMERNILFGTRK